MKFWETAARTLTARPVFSVCGERQASDDSASQLTAYYYLGMYVLLLCFYLPRFLLGIISTSIWLSVPNAHPKVHSTYRQQTASALT